MGAGKGPREAFLIQGAKVRVALNDLILSKHQWKRGARQPPGKVDDPGRSGADDGNPVFQRFQRWAVNRKLLLQSQAISLDRHAI